MWNSKHESLCVICDVGSATVSAGLVLFSRGKKPVILFTTHLPISVSPNPDFNHLENLVLNLFDKLLVTVSIEGFKSLEIKNKRIDTVYIVLSNPWFALKSSQVVISDKISFNLDEEIIEKSIKHEELSFEKEALLGKFEQVNGKDIRMIEREILAVKLNGYVTPDPYGKRASHAELSVYMSLTPEILISSFEKTVNKHIHAKNVSFHTFPLIFYGALRQMFPHEEDLLLVDVAGETTDITLVKDGIIEKSVAIPFGKNSLIRKLMDSLSVTEEIAHSYLHLSKMDVAEATTKETIASVIDKNGEEWKKAFRDVCVSLPISSAGITYSCFLTSDDEVSHLYSSRIKETSTDLSIQSVIPIIGERLNDFVVLGKRVSEDSFLSLGAIFFSREIK